MKSSLFKDTTSLLIKNGRKLLIKNLKNENIEKAKEIFDYLNNEVQNEEYIAFYPLERHLTAMNLGIFDEILFELKDFSASNVRKPLIFPEEDLYYHHLQQISRDHLPELNQKIGDSPLAQDEKDFLKVHLNYALFSPQFKDITQEILNAHSNEFLNKHPESPYGNFIRQYIRREWVVSKWGFGFEFFTGYGHFTDNLANQINHNIPIGISFDVAYKKLNFNFRDYISISKLKTDLAAPDKPLWEKGNKASIIIGEISAGYFIVDNKNIRIYPSVGIAGFGLTSPIAEQEEDARLEDVGFSFKRTYWYGATFDFKLKKGKNIVNAFRPEESDWLLRIRAGYYDPTFSEEVSDLTGGMWSVTVGIAGFGRVINRKK